MATFDLNILPIHRQNGQEFADLPGLLAVASPRKAARGRERDSLILYLMLSGNAVFSTGEVKQITSNAANLFFQTTGSLTSAMRKTAENINTALHERNLSTTSRGQYALGLLVIAVIRENVCTVSLSGPAHVVQLSDGEQRHIYDPALSGKGLGSGQNVQAYLSQFEFQSDNLIVLCGKFPKDWEADLLYERPTASLDASYRKLTFTKGDLNAIIIQPQNGNGTITVLRPEVSASRPQPVTAPDIEEPIESEKLLGGRESELLDGRFESEEESDESDLESEDTLEETEAASGETVITEDELDTLADIGVHLLQPSAYAIPPQPESVYPEPEESPSTESAPTGLRTFPPSIPRAKPVEPKVEVGIKEEDDIDLDVEDETPAAVRPQPAAPKPEKPGAHAEAARQMAKVMVGGIQTGRRANERFGNFLRNFIPKLLPGTDSQQPLILPTYVMVFIAIIIPVLVAVVSWIVYSKYGLNETYHELYQKALVTNAQLANEMDPTRQRDVLNEVIKYLDQAEQYRETDESKLLRAETQAKYDNLMGVIRLEFIPAFTNGIGNGVQISRMAASESDLYMLDAENGNILHAAFTGRSLEPDSTFTCQPGTYGGHQVGTIVDILALPKDNAVGASVLGIDTTGNLLYCTPSQVPQVFPLPPLPNKNWGRITSFALENDRLYVLDAVTREVWIYNGIKGTFTDLPFFYFSNEIPPSIDTAIDLAINGGDLFLLHGDGHLSTCRFGLTEESPTRCMDPVPRVDPRPAHKDMDIFAQAHFTHMSITNPPNPVILLLDADRQQVFRFTLRQLELQNQITGYAGKASPFQPLPVDAMTISPYNVLYLAIGNQVYFATNIP